MKRSLAFTVALLTCSTLLLILNARPPSSQATPTYLGSEACKECHQEQWDGFLKNPHARAEKDAAVVAEQVGCEGCHGPGSAHAAASGDRSDPGFATIRNFKALAPEQASETCRGCHTAGDQLYWDQSPHARRDVACTTCHSIHHSPAEATTRLLAKKNVNELCLGCHRDKRQMLARTGHMPLREGGMSCVDCHSPHGTAGPNQVRAASNNDLCTQCHADKRGPFLWEHAPVRENCLTCHEPHGSNNDKVLAGKRPFLCQRCHIATRHPSTLYDAPDLVSNRLFNRSCTNCHTQIHGSNHPSGKTFLR